MNQPSANLPQLLVLQSNDLERLLAISPSTTYAPGTVLIESGQVSEFVYLSLTGSLDVALPQATNSQHLMRLASGEIVGETSLLDLSPSIVQITVAEPANILVLPRQPLTQLLEKERDFSSRFYQLLSINLSERLRQLSKVMATRNIKEGEPLRKVLVVFATLNDSDIAWMVANGNSVKIASGTVLIQQDQEVAAVSLLMEGTVGIYITLDDNGSYQEKKLAQRVKGEILGDVSFVDGGMASVTVKALDHTWVLSIPRSKLVEKLASDGAFAGRFYRAIAQTMFNRCQDLLSRGAISHRTINTADYLSEDIEIEDEIDLDVLDGTAIAGTRFDWMIQQLRR